MNCREARLLLSQGMTPGSSTPDRAALGFHLVGCPACRAYREAIDQRLLTNLLGQQSSPPPQPRTPAARPQVVVEGPRWQTSLIRTLWYIGVGSLAAIALAFVIIVGWAALSIFHTHQNVQAMIVPTETATATALTIVAPTQRPRPSASPPTPTHERPTATPAPTAPPSPTATPAAPSAGDPVTVLLLGSDRRPDETGPSRTDAIMIARIDPRGHRIALLSLPRDLWVEIPNYGHTRINAASVWGETYDAPGGGIGLARKTVSNLLGISIDYTMYIDFQGFIGAIDALGGVTVNVQKEIYDPQFPTMDYGYTVAHFLPGPQQMDGATALMYSRVRHPDSDFARMRRQQAVVVAIMTRFREQNTLAALKSIEDVTTALREFVKTDIPEERIVGLTWALRDFAPGKVEHYVLDEEMVSFGIGDDRYAEVAQPGAIDELVQKLLGSAAP